MSLMRECRSSTWSRADRNSTPSLCSLSFILLRVFIMSSFSCVLVSHSLSFRSSLAISSEWSKRAHGVEDIIAVQIVVYSQIRTHKHSDLHTHTNRNAHTTPTHGRHSQANRRTHADTNTHTRLSASLAKGITQSHRCTSALWPAYGDVSNM